MADLVDRVFENPASSGGLMVVALTAAAIVSNAMFLQNGHRPDPLFGPRPTVTRSAPVPIPVPAPTPAPASIAIRAPQVVAPIPPLPRPAPAVEAAPPSAPSIAPLIADIQRELARLGLYAGAIDGRPGSHTSAAISHYEAAAGRPVTGKPTTELLQAMKQPLPSAAQPAATAPGPDPVAAELDQREQQRAGTIAAAQKTKAAVQMQANYRIIQGALNRIGYGPVPVDGSAGQETIDAIRRFELDNGLPVSGEPSDDLIARLIAIGAIKPT